MRLAFVYVLRLLVTIFSVYSFSFLFIASKSLFRVRHLNTTSPYLVRSDVALSLELFRAIFA